MDTQHMSRDAASQDVLIGYGAGNSIAIIDLGQEIAFRATTYLNKLLSIIAARALQGALLDCCRIAANECVPGPATLTHIYVSTTSVLVKRHLPTTSTRHICQM